MATALLPELTESSTSASASVSGSSSNEEARDRDRDRDKPAVAVVVDPRAIALLEMRVLALVDEAMEADAGVLSAIKRHVVALLCKSIGSFFNGTVVKWLQEQAQPETAAAQTSSLVQLVRELFWPEGVLLQFAAAEEDEAAAATTDQKLRAEGIAKLNTMLPSILQVHAETHTE